MFSVKEAGRLLRSDWKSGPVELARELYNQITSRSTKVVESPVEIAVEVGRTALKLTRPNVVAARASEVVRGSGAPSPRKLPTVLPPPAPGPREPTALRPATMSAKHSGRPSTRPPGSSPRKPRDPLRPAYPVATPVPPRAKTASPAPAPSPLPVQSGPIPESIARPAPPPAPPIPNFATAYLAPLFEVAGEARFSGPDPVQFDRKPVVYDPITATYEPLDFTPRLTKIPRENAFDQWYGVVDSTFASSGAGVTKFNVKIYPFPGAELEDTVVVTMFDMDTLYPLVKGAACWPIFQCPIDGQFYCRPRADIALAKTTGVITERVTGTMGKGNAQMYSMDSTTGVTTIGPSGNVTVFSISGHPTTGAGTIASGVWIVIVRFLGAWFVVAADCSGAA